MASVPKPDARTGRAYVEFLLLYAVLPSVFALGVIPLPKLSVLFGVTIFCVVMLSMRGFFWKHEFRFSALGQAGREITRRLLFVAVGAVLLTLLLVPDQLFAFPIERPLTWGLVVLLYPFLSALPQEIIYRTYLHKRFGPLFGGERNLTIVSATAFAYLHIVYVNLPSIALSFAGGMLLASTYERRQSLAAAWVEHAGYGVIVFTTGLGKFFYSG